MKLELIGSKEKVSSVHFSIKTKDTALLLINTVERWIKYDVVARINGTIEFYYYSSGKTDKIVLTPETEEDIKILKRLRYELHEKDQLEILFVDRSLI